jgi:hypothetical protein
MFLHLQIILAFRFVIIMCVTYKLYKTLCVYRFYITVLQAFHLLNCLILSVIGNIKRINHTAYKLLL